MEQLKTYNSLKEFVRKARTNKKSISFVPTMGALHEGHLSLVYEGLKRTDICIPYIFLNPKQFAPTEDLASYPRTLDRDLELLKSVGASAVYLPRLEDVYPNGFVTKISLGGVALPLEGEHRPLMFDGVATVVSKMLLQCLPDIALFGEKDYQQLMVIKQLVKDLNIPVEIIGVPTMRDEYGLALSSRNTYLNDKQLSLARGLNETMKAMISRYRAQEGIAMIEDWAHKKLLSQGFHKIDYIVVRDSITLGMPTQHTKDLRILAAVWLENTRLIDNMAL